MCYKIEMLIVKKKNLNKNAHNALRWILTSSNFLLHCPTYSNKRMNIEQNLKY